MVENATEKIDPIDSVCPRTSQFPARAPRRSTPGTRSIVTAAARSIRPFAHLPSQLLRTGDSRKFKVAADMPAATWWRGIPALARERTPENIHTF